MMRFGFRLSLLSLLIAAFLAPGVAGAAPSADASRACSVGNTRSYGTTYVLSISARRVTCSRAREIVRAFHACRPGKSGRCPRVAGYSCSEERFNRSRLSYDSRVICRRGAKVVKHTYTQFL
jgi:hypothetical protein